MYQNFRESQQGDTHDLKLQIRDLNTQLRDRKHANVVLTTENERLKRQLYDLQQRLVDIEMGREGKKGEASTMSALRMKVQESKQRGQAMAANYEQAIAANQQLVEDIQALGMQLEAMQGQLQQAEDGWKAARQDVEALQEQTDGLERERNKLADQVAALQAELEATQKAAVEQAAGRSKAEGLAAQLDAEIKRLREDHRGAMAKEIGAATAAVQAQADAALAAKQAEMEREVGVRDKALAEVRAQLAALVEAASPVMPQGLTVREAPLLPQPIPGTDGGSGTAAAAVPGTAGTASGSTGSTDGANCLELLVHDLALNTSAAGIALYDLWAALVLDCPGLGRPRLLLAPEPSSTAMPISQLFRLGFGPEDASIRDAVGLLASGTAKLCLYNLKASVIGGLRCTAPEGHPSAGQLLPVVACALEHAPGVIAVEFFRFDAETSEPRDSVMTLSIDWSQVLPVGAAPPAPGEFVVDLRGLDPLALEAVRMCGLFMPGRSFTGLIPGAQPGAASRSYQVWGLADERARAQATRRFLDKELKVLADAAAASRPLASATMPLAAALTAPSSRAVEASALRAAVQKQARPGVLEPAAVNGTRTLTLRTALDAGLGVVQLTARLKEEVPLGGSLLQVVQGTAPAPAPGAVARAAVPDPGAAAQAPAQQQQQEVVWGPSGPIKPPPPAPEPAASAPPPAVAAPPLPPLHWACAMAAEQVAVGKLLSNLAAAVMRTSARLCMGGAVEPKQQDECQQATLQAIDTMQSHAEQLAGCVATCETLVPRALAASPWEGELAASMVADLQRHIHRSVSRLLLGLQESYSLGSLASSLWPLTSSTSASAPGASAAPAAVAAAPGQQAAQLLAGPGDPGLAAPSAQQVSMLSSLKTALLSMRQQLHNTRGPAKGAGTLPAGPASTAQQPLAQAYAEAALEVYQGATAGSSATPTAPGAAPSSAQLQAAASSMSSSLGPALDAAAAAAGEAAETCRKHLGAPPAGSSGDEVQLAAEAQARMAAALGPVTAGLVQGLSALAQAAAVTLQQEAAMPVTPAAGGVPSPGAAPAPAASPGGIARQQLSAVVVQLQVALVRLFKADPTGLPPAGAHVASAWLRASFRLYRQLGASSAFYTALAASSLGQALLVGGQRAAGVQLCLEGVSGQVVQLVQGLQGVLGQLKASKVYDEPLLDAELPSLMAHTSHYLTALTVLAHDLATHLLCLPLLTSRNVAWSTQPWHGLPLTVTVSGAHQLLPCPPHLLKGPAAAAAAANVGGAGAGAGAGSMGGAAPTSAGPPTGAALTKALLDACTEGAPNWRGSRKMLLLTVDKAALLGHVRSAVSLLGWASVTLFDYTSVTPAGSSDRDLVAAAAAEVEAALVVLPEQDAGSLLKWLGEQGVPLLRPEQDAGLRAALQAAAAAAAAVGGAADLPPLPFAGALPEGPVAQLARTLAGRIGLARLHQAAQALQGGSQAGGQASGYETPRPGQQQASLPAAPDDASALLGAAAGGGSAAGSGQGPSQGAAAATPALATYLPDMGAVKPLLAASRAATQKLGTALRNLQDFFATHAKLQGPLGSMVQSAAVALAQRQLLFEGLLEAPELLAAAKAQAASAAAVAAAAQAAAAATAAVAGGTTPVLSRRPSGIHTPVPPGAATPTRSGVPSLAGLPPMQRPSPKVSVSGAPLGAGQPPTEAALAAAAAAALVAGGPQGPGAGGAAGMDDGASTASEDQELNVLPVRRPMGAYGQATGDDSELESDAASVASMRRSYI